MRFIRRVVSGIAIVLALGLFLAKRYSFHSRRFYQSSSMFSVNGHGMHERKWWKEAVVYEVYLPSFKDSNKDGIGDIQGVVSKLDYLQQLGVDVVSVGPFYQSPQVDMGYDVSDYEEVHRPYGTLEDVQILINATHARGMRIVLDLVINHSSNLHKWFQESRSSKQNPKRDWYFWRPARIDAAGNRHPPNNWRSHFTVPAWTWDETTEEYYLHIYSPEMPDFNWENEECRRAIYETAIVFWLERGIDGFRIDTANKYSKEISFPDAEIRDPNEETQLASKYYRNGPRIHEFLGEMRSIFDRYDAISIGELSNFKRVEEDVMPYVSAGARQLNMVFNLDIVNLGQDRHNRKVPPPFKVAAFKRELSRWQTFVSDSDAWITIFLENHDQGRSISRFASDSSPRNQLRSGKMLAMVMATMTGTLFLYQGQEIGMINIPNSWPVEEYKDVRSVNFYNRSLERNKDNATALAAALEDMKTRARDHGRTPVQWDATANAGFSPAGVSPWMRINDDWKENNIEKLNGDQNGLLEFWKNILKLRKKYKDLFIYGRYELLEADNENLFVFMKEGNRTKSITAVNMSNTKRKWKGPPASFGSDCKPLLTNVKDMEEGFLKPWEGRVYISDP